jgi:hypothetical protein
LGKVEQDFRNKIVLTFYHMNEPPYNHHNPTVDFLTTHRVTGDNYYLALAKAKRVLANV